MRAPRAPGGTSSCSAPARSGSASPPRPAALTAPRRRSSWSPSTAEQRALARRPRRRPRRRARRAGARPCARDRVDASYGARSSPAASTSPLDCVGSSDSIAAGAADRRGPAAASCSSACPAASSSTSRAVVPRARARRRVCLRHRDTGRRRRAAHLRPRLRARARRRLGRLVSATYPLARYREALDHAATPAGAAREGRVRPPQRTREEPLMPRPGFVLEVDARTPPLLVPRRRGLPAREASRRAPASSTRRSRSTALARRRRRDPRRAAATRSTPTRCPRCSARA